MPRSIHTFIDTWLGATGSERGNKDRFLTQLCEALGLPEPEQTKPGSEYCFEFPVPTINEDGTAGTKKLDLYKRGCFILEAKQTSDKIRGAKPGKKGGQSVSAPHLPGLEEPGAKPYEAISSYDQQLVRVFGQLMGYAKALALHGEHPPFLIACDIGHSFHLWNIYDGGYGGFGARQVIGLQDLAKPGIQELFRDIWTQPEKRNLAAERARVTRAIAKDLGGLAQEIRAGRGGERSVAQFLMRCVFTFFAEDIGLLPEKVFQQGLRKWEKDHQSFAPDLHSLWETMDTGGRWGFESLLQFNGGLFKDTSVPALSQQQIARLRLAADQDWSKIEPSIFGTLLESALGEEERHHLGAHYTPRAYIQRLIDATFGEDLRREWDQLQEELDHDLSDKRDAATNEAAVRTLEAFRLKLGAITVLDPACGSGNFLFVAYDTIKRLEAEVLRRLEDLGRTRLALSIESEVVTPRHFLGLELNEWAASIAELVLWIAHLQWFRRTYEHAAPPQPVLQNYGSIHHVDAVLAHGKPVKTSDTNWDGKTTKLHRLTGRNIPDAAAQKPVLAYPNAKPAAWPQADYIVGNPPFLGNKRMREALGDGYAKALREAYPDVPESVDLVLYWWHKAALKVRSGEAKRFGLITTNSLGQAFHQPLLLQHLHAKEHPLKLVWAIPDHPWTKNEKDAAVRIAMTVGARQGQAQLFRVAAEVEAATPELEAESLKLEGGPVEEIHEDLSAGARVTSAVPLKANAGISCRGVIPHGKGFLVDARQFEEWGRPAVVKPYRNGRDLTDRPRGQMVIDLHGLSEPDVRRLYPAIYQHVLEHVKPERDVNKDSFIRGNWWIFARSREESQQLLRPLSRYIATPYTSKFRVFQFLKGDILPDDMVVAIASSDAFHLGVLSSAIHAAWATASGSTLEDRPRYNNSRCFDPFPFPDATEPQASRIRELGEELDAHLKRAQAQGVTLTEMYNLLEQGRTGPLNEADRKRHDKALTGLLGKIHEDLDRAVAEAYGWPSDLLAADILARLLELNRLRSREESKGHVRYLRPEVQAPAGLSGKH